MRITVNAQREEIHIKKSVKSSLWNQTKEVPRGKDKNSRELNDYIENARIRLFQIFTKLEQDGKRITAEILKNKFFRMDDEENQEMRPIPISQRYRSLMDQFPDLFYTESTNILGFRSREEDPEKIWNRAKTIVEYVTQNVLLVFALSPIPGSGTDRSNAAAFADLAGNVMVMFDKGCKKWEENLIHELGHAFGLQHSFHTTCLMVPEKVDFNKNSWHNKLTPDPSDPGTATYDYLAYAATYYNIMDYHSTVQDQESNVANLKYRRTSFTKWQWQKMLGNIKGKSYLAARFTKDINGLNDIRECYSDLQTLQEFNQQLLNLLD